MPVNPNKFKTWSLEYNDYDDSKEKSRESLLTIGNGYLGTRGALEEVKASDTNYPGTYISGLYNRLISKVAGRDIENEDLVNIPNWVYINFRIDDSDWLDFDDVEIISINRSINFYSGLLEKEMLVKDKQGRETKISSRRFASMANQHLVGIRYKIKPLNYSGKLEIRSVLDGNIINDGVARYRELNQQHLKPLEEGCENELSWLTVKTVQSGIEIVQTAEHSVFVNGQNCHAAVNCEISTAEVNSYFTTHLNDGDELIVEKVVAVYTSKHDDVKKPLSESRKLIESAGTFSSILKESKNSWKKIWDKIDIRIEGDPKSQMLVRLHLYHLMVSASPNNKNIDAGIAARGLHGEAYRGHIFWDELYIMPLYNLFLPEVAKNRCNLKKRLG